MMKKLYLVIIILLLSFNCQSQEIFADYFDINWGATSGIEVMGKLNLKRNKDYKAYPIPKTYQFTLLKDISNSFEIETEFDPKGRIFGVIKVKRGVTLPKQDREYSLSISLKDGFKELVSKTIIIHLKENSLWSQLHQNYLLFTSKITKLYGRFKYSDDDLSTTIDALLKNDGKFSFSIMYGAHPGDYLELQERRNMSTEQKREVRRKGIEGDWTNVLKHIGGLGYAYAHSKEFGINSNNPEKTELLKKAIYLSAYQFMSNVGIEGDDILIDGKPAGPYLGDGFATMDKYNMVSHEMTTHQWEMTDALASPLAHVMPSLLKDKADGDKLALALFNVMRDYFQLFFAEVEGRRMMNDKQGRWREIQDDKHSNGAWSDANIGHRYRCLMLLPIIFADYNQPITYVPYWYDDFYRGTEFEGKSFAKDFSPRGVLTDLRALSKLFSVPTFEYGQSGFNPDGSISHHCDAASDVAMYDYGFHWLVNTIVDGKYWYNTAKPVDIDDLQFIANRYNKVYANMIYKNRLDFTIVGRSHLANIKKFVETEFIEDGESLLNLIPKGKKIQGQDYLEKFLDNIKKFTHKKDTSMAFWNADYVLHRKESEGDQYYFSVKNKSTRTIGAEDFSEIRKSWHFGSGVFQLKVKGDEYSQIKLNKWDHHVVPGVTEEWKTDELPKGHSAASGPGLNEFSGQLSNGTSAMAAYHHNPSDTYASASALKSYYMIDNVGTAIGTDVKRAKKGQGMSIVTTVDQIYFDKLITYFDGKKVVTLSPKDSHDIEFSPNEIMWVHCGDKGYMILPEKKQKIIIKTNDYVNVTNKQDSTFIRHYTGHYFLQSPEYGSSIIAIDHGTNPSKNGANQYHYAMIANVSVAEMPELMNFYQKNLEVKRKNGVFHAVYNKENNLSQITLFKAGRVAIGNNWFELESPALIMCKENANEVELSVSNPLHTLNNKEIIIKTNLKLKPGIYQYQLKGIQPQKGEHFKVIADGESTIIVVELPDQSDAERYNYQEMMYAGSPLIVTIPFLN